MARFNKKKAEQIVELLCREQIITCGNVLYKSFNEPSVNNPRGVRHVYSFCKYIEETMRQEFGDTMVMSRPAEDFTLSQNLMTLIQKYGIRIDIEINNNVIIDSSSIDDNTLYYKYGICRPGFVDSVKSYLEFKDMNKLEAFIETI